MLELRDVHRRTGRGAETRGDVVHGLLRDDPAARQPDESAALDEIGDQSLDDLLPYYTKELRTGLSKMPADMKVSYLQMNRRVLKDLKVTTENVAESKAEFQLTARNADGQATQGSVTMIKEGGIWKIDEDAWVGPPPKKGH